MFLIIMKIENLVAWATAWNPSLTDLLATSKRGCFENAVEVLITLNSDVGLTRIPS